MAAVEEGAFPPAAVEAMGSKRILWIDNARFFLIFFVVLGHFSPWILAKSFWLERIQFYVYLFHMPAFIFLSGMMARHTVKNGRYDRILSYLLLYGFMKLLFYYTDRWTGTAAVSFDLFSEDGVPWYALAMAWWILITFLTRKVPYAWVLIISLLLSLLVGYSEGIGGFPVIRRTLVFYPFFHMGYLMDPERFRSFGGRPAAGDPLLRTPRTRTRRLPSARIPR